MGYATYDYSHGGFEEPFLYSFSITSAGVREQPAYNKVPE
jgi:hypothetical protein